MDETCVGGLRKNMLKHTREQLEGRIAAGKTAVVGIKYRDLIQPNGVASGART